MDNGQHGPNGDPALTRVMLVGNTEHDHAETQHQPLGVEYVLEEIVIRLYAMICLHAIPIKMKIYQFYQLLH